LKIKTIIIAVATLLILVLLALGAVIFTLASLNRAPEGAPLAADGVEMSQGNVFVDVREGEGARAVGRRLKAANLIKNERFWYLLSRFDQRNGGKFLRAGVYEIKPGSSASEIRRILTTESGQILYRVTVPEGLALHRIAAIMENAGVCDAEAFLAAASSPEMLAAYRIPGKDMCGYLYPDTYRLPKNAPADLAVRTMADTFFLKLAGIPNAAKASPEEIYKKVTLASVVECEYRAEDEAPLIAGVFENRLKRGMRLESCATVVYVITEIEGKPHPKRIFYADTEIPNPYNTYLNAGLPPGPIACPGMVALNAAWNPEPSDFLFFRLVDPAEGRHHFSKTFGEHTRAETLYVKGR
jgi:UPF0755 protein